MHFTSTYGHLELLKWLVSQDVSLTTTNEVKDTELPLYMYCLSMLITQCISYSGYFSWGKTFVVFVVVKETTNIFLTKIYY